MISGYVNAKVTGALIPPVDSLKMGTYGVSSVKLTEFIPPVVFIGYGFLSLGNNAIRDLDLSVQKDMQEDHPAFLTTADNLIQYSPIIAAYGLGFAGVKGRNNFVDKSGSLFISIAIIGTSVSILKKTVGRERPDDSAFSSFPSGHTSLAFVGAEFLYQEYKDRSVWFGIAGYSLATATGILRVYNNVHWFSDIVAGAGFGVASTKLGYLLYPHIKQLVFGSKSQNFSLNPGIMNGKAGFTLYGQF